jgi:hypothetical protein
LPALCGGEAVTATPTLEKAITEDVTDKPVVEGMLLPAVGLMGIHNAEFTESCMDKSDT